MAAILFVCKTSSAVDFELELTLGGLRSEQPRCSSKWEIFLKPLSANTILPCGNLSRNPLSSYIVESGVLPPYPSEMKFFKPSGVIETKYLIVLQFLY